MSKPHSRIGDYAVYVLVRAIVCVIQAMSFETARGLALGLAWLAYRIDRRHRDVACENLRHAFPGRYTDEQLTKLVKGVYAHLCTLIVEIAHLQRRVHPRTWRQHLELACGPQLVERLLSGRPLLLVTGHFGNWEFASYSLGLLGFAAHAVARPLDNPYLDDYLRRFRQCSGQKILAKKGDFDQMQAILDSGGVLGTLADQDAGQRGLFVDFFGRPASTHKAIALLILEHRVPLMVTAAVRRGHPMRYEVAAEDLIYPEEYDGNPDAVRAITQRFTSALERMVRRNPEQYFWLHRRWKHQPKQKKSKQAA